LTELRNFLRFRLRCGGRFRRWRRRNGKFANRAQYFAPITKNDAHFLQVLIGQIGKNREINTVFGKALRVLGHAEFFEPVRNLLHCGVLRLQFV
jgi:hypothetical protein